MWRVRSDALTLPPPNDSRGKADPALPTEAVAATDRVSEAARLPAATASPPGVAVISSSLELDDQPGRRTPLWGAVSAPSASPSSSKLNVPPREEAGAVRSGDLRALDASLAWISRKRGAPLLDDEAPSSS